MVHGTLRITVTENQPTVCASQVFSTPFSNDDVMVQLSPARPLKTMPMFDTATTWVEYVDRHNLTICVRASARIYVLRVSMKMLL
jgi:hypothetical protein